MHEDERRDIGRDFREAVNMAPAELEAWLATDASKAVGGRGGEAGESTGHRMGRRIVEIKRTQVDALSDDDHRAMRKVVGYVHRHPAQRPAGDVEETPWRYSLTNWGHDPLKAG